MYHQETLFNLPAIENQDNEQTGGTPRLRSPQRNQKEFTISAIDDLIPIDHVARIIWDIVSKLNFSDFLDDVRAVQGAPGRPPVDPRVYLGLWILATIEGIGSARTLDQYCREHHAFIWMLGGVSTNYHSLSDFRNQGDKLERLLTGIVTSLIQQKVVSTESWAQDGMRVRANAGTGSFRRQESLEESVQVAEARLSELKENAHLDQRNLSARKKSAQERAAKERAQRSRDALETLEELNKDIDKRKRSKKDKKELKKKARASTTDPEAKKMKMPNGGYNPAYNVQYVTDTKSRIITGVQTVNEGSDSGLMEPMIKYIDNTYHLVPDNLLVDGGFISEVGLGVAEHLGSQVFMPVPERTLKKHEMGIPLCGDSTAISRWVERMNTEEGKALYKERASSAEFSNASTRNKGFYQFKVRGRLKAHATSLLFALTHNIERIISMVRSGVNISLVFS